MPGRAEAEQGASPRAGRRTIRGRSDAHQAMAGPSAPGNHVPGIGSPLRSVTTIPVSERRAEVDLHRPGVSTEDVAAVIRL